MARRRKPMRRCIGCSSSQPKSDMIRIVRTPDGELRIDRTGKASGRGAYVCLAQDCLRRAFSGKRLARAFRMSSIDVKVRENLLAELQQLIPE